MTEEVFRDRGHGIHSDALVIGRSGPIYSTARRNSFRMKYGDSESPIRYRDTNFRFRGDRGFTGRITSVFLSSILHSNNLPFTMGNLWSGCAYLRDQEKGKLVALLDELSDFYTI